MSKSRCIFTSAGDFNNVAQWRGAASNPSWDLITAFYGDSDREYEALASVSSSIKRRKGSKFQNLKAIFDGDPTLFEEFEYIWVCDDDIMMTEKQIEQSFSLISKLNLWVAQPSFSRDGKAPHEVTITQSDCDVRLVSFLEVTCPIFRADKLRDFLKIYDPNLMGWGIDWWFCHALNGVENWRLGIFDCIQVTNPQPEQRRGGQREILKLASNDERRDQWRAIQKLHNIPEIQQKTLVRMSFAEAGIL